MSVLPHTLLILVHLHLLGYPLKDSSTYDERLFDPTRTGIRERTKALEDISYFLVGKVEGGKGRARSILPTYPCLQPADTTAFRISLAKYLEALRHSSLYPSHGEDRRKGKDDTKKSADTPQRHAWWQDVVVRKSLLEECSGERFERLLLALSIHALFVNTTGPSVPGSLSEAEASRRIEALQTLPQGYACLLELSQSARRGWERSASRLVQQQRDLSVLRERLLDPATTLSLKFDSLSTGRLVALRDSRLHDLLRTTWKNEGGRRALYFFIDLAGLQASPALGDASRPFQTPDVAQDKADVQCTPPTPVPTLPLPIAAAHHPAKLSALNASLFAPPTKTLSTNVAGREANARPSQNPTKDRLAERLASIERTHAALLDAAHRTDNVRLHLEPRSRRARPAPTPSAPVTRSSLDFGIWEGPSRTPIDFKAPSEAPSSSTVGPPADAVVEERIARIRATLLPSYPGPEAHSLKDLDLDATANTPVSTLPVSTSRLPQRSEKDHWRPQGPRDGSGYDIEANRYQPAKADGVAPNVHRPKISDKMDKPRTVDMAAGARKVSRKVSRRASAARARRTTLLSRHEYNTHDDEVDKILDALEDGSPTFADSAQTPKARVGTAGNLLSTVKKTNPRPSFDIEQRERAIDVPLPKLRLSTLDTHDLHAEIFPERHDLHGPVNNEDGDQDEENEEYYEGNSATLRDILLSATEANGGQYALLGEDDIGDDTFEW
ncbi:hypothetical protein DAEQUDRAFT_810432 [Daedalea quercina L-15889]|uniref:HAUS augmin-like complex subunit 6 N-terminal domain-containing protein n=1 Tax=Daedalea quercina L-15889 TaxID=1314783 RepID=A0A165RJW6_9APHY|nr:hypothetical protein DAEQUDRAFT_810432 [Daedalea quercina L-15889]